MNKIKYPRTMHVHWSPGMTTDDKKIENYNAFVGNDVIVTIKKDGENTTGYHDGSMHARSLDSKNHESRNWVKNMWSSVAYKLPVGYRVCGENVYAEHSIAYDNLESYFLGFSVWNDHNVCLSWDETLMWFEELSIVPVEQVYRGPFNLQVLKKITDTLDTQTEEGIVVRVVDEIAYDEFRQKVAKWVRKNHIQSDTHWMHSQLGVNRLK